MKSKNILSNIPDDLSQERFDNLLTGSRFKLERIISKGQATPEGQWYDQREEEWVLLLKGRARIRFERAEVITLQAGDTIHIPAHCRHRVEWTDPDTETIWLALHYHP